MSVPREDAKTTLTSIWSAHSDPAATLDEECSPTKQCRNMRDMTFEGYVSEGGDLRTAWRELLAREGKLNPSGGTIRDLVLGTGVEP